jgi:hypothetical protein
VKKTGTRVSRVPGFAFYESPCWSRFEFAKVLKFLPPVLSHLTTRERCANLFRALVVLHDSNALSQIANAYRCAMIAVLRAILSWPATTSVMQGCRPAEAAAKIFVGCRTRQSHEAEKSGSPWQETNAMGGLPPSEPAR